MKQGTFSVGDLNVVFRVIDKCGRFYLLEHNTKGEDCIVCYDLEKNIYCHTHDSLSTVIEHPLDYNWYSAKR